jgi:uncharacterized protein (TIGR03437 family)
LAQVAPATILKIGTENFTIYLNDETDFAKLATNPEVTKAKPYANFGALIIIADIVAVNCRPARGTHFCRGLNVKMSLNPAPGQAIGDVVGRSTPPFFLILDCVETILWPDGTLIGSITFRGLENTDPLPGAPLEQPHGSLVVTGGSGAFLGVRGQSGALADGVSRSASITEDPSNRRIFGRGQGPTLILHIVPMLRPEIEMTASGNAVFHSDFSPVTAANPAKAGEVLIAMATGLGPTRPGVDPGQPFPPFPANPLQVVNSPVDVTVNGQSASVINAIGWPGLVDAYRVDFVVPAGTASGTAAIQLTSAWITGPGVTIAVQ